MRVLEGKTEIESRYLNDRIYNYLDTTFEIPDQFMYDIIKITKDYVARPDLISYKAYNTDMYADVICKLNGISNPFELNEGDVIVIPTYDYLDEFIVRPNNIELEDTDQDTVPVSKKKNEKRKANEAVVGDKRFSIDKNNRVIIY